MSIRLLRLTLNNYKCHREKQVVFTDQNINLLSSPTGSGKSTLFDAIRWCLFGDVRNIHPHDLTDKTVTWVYLELPHMSIFRQRNPGLLRVRTSQLETEDKNSGQNLIDQWFGQKDIWRATSYIAQDLRHSLMIQNSEYCINVLNHLAFQGQEPRKIISSIINRKNSCLSNLNRQDAAFKRECDLLQESIQQVGSYIQYYYSDEQMQNLESSLASEYQLQNELKYKQLENRKNQGRLESLNRTLNNLSIIDCQPEILSVQLTRLQSIYNEKKSQYEAKQHSQRNIKEYENKLTTLEQTVMVEPTQFNYPSFQPRTIKTPIESDWATIQHQKESICNETITELQLQMKDNDNNLTLTKKNKQEIDDNLTQIQQQISAYESDTQAQIKLKQLPSSLAQILAYEDKRNHHQALADKIQIEYSQNSISSITNLFAGQQTELNNKIKETIIYNKALAEYQVGIKKAEQLKCEYSDFGKLECLSNQQNILQNLIIKQKDLERSLIYWQHQDKISQLELELRLLTDVKSNEELVVSKNILQQLEQSRGVHSCPHCSQGIRIVNGELKPDQVIPNLEDSINQQKMYIQYATEANQRYHKKERIQSEIGYSQEAIHKLGLTEVQPNRTSVEELETNKLLQQETQQLIYGLQNLIILPKPEINGDWPVLDKLQEELTILQGKIHQIRYIEFLLPSEVSSNDIRKQLETYQIQESERQDKLQNCYSQRDKIRGEQNGVASKLQTYEYNERQIQQKLITAKNSLEKIPNEIQILKDIYRKEYEQYQQEYNSELKREKDHELAKDKAWNDYQLTMEKIQQQKEQRMQSLKQYQEEINNIRSQMININWTEETVIINSQQTFILKGSDQSYLDCCQNIINKIQHILDSRNQVLKQKEQLISEINTIVIDSAIDNNVEVNNTRITQYQQALQWGSQVRKIYSWRHKLENEQSSIKDLSSDVGDWDKLQHLALSIEHTLLDETIEHINSLLDDVCSQLFDLPIIIRLKLLKSLKSKNEERPKFNIHVNYHGVDYDSINDLSGGEKDRISFALSIALSQRSLCNFILLDECKFLYSIGYELKARALSLLPKLLPNKIICLIDHVPIAGDDGDIGFIDAFTEK